MGGSSGGGGSSGAVSFPAYLQNAHHDWINKTSTIDVDLSMVDCLNTTWAANPWVGKTPYDPAELHYGSSESDIQHSLTQLSNYGILVTAMAYKVDYTDIAVAASSVATTLLDSAAVDITAELAAYGKILDDEFEVQNAEYRVGMNNINAVMSSSFVLGSAKLYGFRDRDYNKYAGDLRLKLRDTYVSQGITTMSQHYLQKIEFQRALTALTSEIYRTIILEMTEYIDNANKMDEEEALWNIKLYTFAGNILAAPSGGTIPGETAKTNKWNSALGGALSGAAAGAMIGSVVPGIGTGVGAGIGAIIGGGRALMEK